jgi:hypothetical protein
MQMIDFAVNGTLMRGLELNGNLQKVGAVFVREDVTAPMYRLWTIADRHPAMLRVSENGQAIALEIWSITPDALGAILLSEPAGLCIGKIVLCEGQKEITSYGGWRAYTAS